MFFLHPTFHNPVREVLQHPFEIEEHGWGEFELSVVVRLRPNLAAVRDTPTPQPSAACLSSTGCREVGGLRFGKVCSCST